MYITSILRKLHSVFLCYLTHVIESPHHFPESTFPPTILNFHWIIFSLPIHIELMSETIDFHVMKYTCPRFLFPSAQKKAFHRDNHLGRGTIAIYNGLHMTM